MSRIRIFGESADFFNTTEGVIITDSGNEIGLFGKKVGEDCEVIRVLPVGCYSVTAEYADPFFGDDPAEGGFNCIEVQLED